VPRHPRLILTTAAVLAVAVAGLTTLATSSTAASPAVAAHPAAAHLATPVLGIKGFMGSNGRGWGLPHPATIDNGGDPSGQVVDLTWHNWGSEYSQGWGRTSIFKPGGGFYPHLVRAELRAAGLGHCVSNGPRAYTRLFLRVPRKPGGPLGPWTRWAGARSICVPRA
jgi:hypothetical protein